jgi:4-hydroxysphinganine ceramide fatty acyl 2-hydroxylase
MIEAPIQTMPEAAPRLAAPAAPAGATPLRYVSNEDESCRMFESELREKLSHIKPWVPHVLFVPVLGVSLVAAFRTDTPARVAAFYAVGLFLWTMVEYTIHRGIFHTRRLIEEDTLRIAAALRRDQPVVPNLPSARHRFYFVAHGVHHNYPNDSTRLVLAPGVSIPLALFFYGLFRLIFGAATPAAYAGLISGYLCYDTIHYAVHHASGRSILLRSLKRRHFRHHYADSTRDFGVSSPLWDYIIGTLGSAETARQR